MTPTLNEHFYASGIALYDAGKVDEAESAFSVLCTRDQSDPRFRFGLAASKQEKGLYEEAAREWGIAIQVAQAANFPVAKMHCHKAECHLSLAQRQEAKKELAEAKKMAWDDHELLTKINLLLQRNGL